MPARQHLSQPWSVAIAFVAGDASKSIKAAPGPTNKLVITKMHVHIITSNAATCDFEDTSGTIEVMKLGASPPVNGRYDFELERGVELTVNEAFLYKPSAAGNAGHIAAEGYIVGGYTG